MRAEMVAIIFIAVFLALDTVAGTHLHAIERPTEQKFLKILYFLKILLT